jgi:uncharacterized repeat protein (TIGR03803 family)
MKKIFFLLFFLLTEQFTGFSQNYVLYGITANGGSGSSEGVIFCYEPISSNCKTLVNFNVYSDISPIQPLGGSLVQDTVTGFIYGLSEAGGTFNEGTIFRYNPTNDSDTVIYNFHTPTGIQPYGSLTLASNGLLYGMTNYFNIYDGVFFSFKPNTYNYTDIFSFDTANGAAPAFCQPLQAIDGMIYGMTPSGGTNNIGILFRYDPILNKDTVLLNFNSVNGAGPDGSLIQASNGLLYGMTPGGGSNNSGVLFSYNPVTYKDSVLYNFGGVYGGVDIESDLLQASNGSLYAIIPNNSGGEAEIFWYNPITGEDTAVYLRHSESFSPNSNNDLIQDPDNGLLYGTTSAGGDSSVGTLFSFDPVTYKDSVLVNFHEYSSGQEPVGRLLLSKSIPNDTVTGIHKLPTISGRVYIYPNPNNGSFILSLLNINQKCNVEIYNVLGDEVYFATLKQVQGDNLINLTGQSSGIYLYRVITENGELIGEGKVIIER